LDLCEGFRSEFQTTRDVIIIEALNPILLKQ
jgi:hypothetical protein